MTGATICSGILAPETAMPWVDWKWCAEIEPFPCSVIKARHTELPNLGDVTAASFIEQVMERGYLDLLVAGTPCQAFSVAGLRKSLKDSRGNITLRLVEIVHAIRPGSLLWENVPGVLSTDDNAFGCFLAGLVGADEAIAPATGWTSAGVVSGPLGTAAWRILDAQYFGLAQRRARLFLVFCFGDSADPAEILFEFESLRRDYPPSREAGQRVAPTTEGRAGRSGANNFNTSGGLICPDDLTGTLSARNKGGGGLGTDFDLGGGADTVPALTRRNSTDEECCGELCPTLRSGGNHTGGDRPPGTDVDTCDSLVAIPILEAGARTGKSTDDPRAGIGIGESGDPMFTLQSGKQHAIGIGLGSDPLVSDDIAQPITGRNGDPGCVAFSQKDSGADASSDLAPTLRSMGHDKSHANGGGQLAVAFRACGQEGFYPSEVAPPITTTDGGGAGVPTTNYGMAVRRLTPEECERLQGFPDGYTAVLHRGKPAADGPRYKALGNSMAVPCIAWLGERIRRVFQDKLRCAF